MNRRRISKVYNASGTTVTMEGSKSSSTTMQVSFVCQRCCQPLKLDTSFNVLDRVTIQELTAPLVTVTPSKQADISEGETAPEETFVENSQMECQKIHPTPACVWSYCHTCKWRKRGLLAELQQLKEEEALVQELEAVEEQRAAVAQDLAESRIHSQQLDTEELQPAAVIRYHQQLRLELRLPSVPVGGARLRSLGLSRMERGKVNRLQAAAGGSYSIKTQFNSEEQWAKSSSSCSPT
ncbi:beclin-1 [Lates japonicus]|uniref:Beclin-1 n=1 Tax=Lates japonicus TaxID=270547 RepID=A0AAD3MWF8_LATJO|nr:beclin-1 [Lates japonicus]